MPELTEFWFDAPTDITSVMLTHVSIDTHQTATSQWRTRPSGRNHSVFLGFCNMQRCADDNKVEMGIKANWNSDAENRKNRTELNSCNHRLMNRTRNTCRRGVNVTATVRWELCTRHAQSQAVCADRNVIEPCKQRNISEERKPTLDLLF